MVSAVRCPACLKYQLVEAADRGKSIPCLICKKPFVIQADAAPAKPPTPVAPVRLPPMRDVNLDV